MRYTRLPAAVTAPWKHCSMLVALASTAQLEPPPDPQACAFQHPAWMPQHARGPAQPVCRDVPGKQCMMHTGATRLQNRRPHSISSSADVSKTTGILAVKIWRIES
jgi:hypothetical protein